MVRSSIHAAHRSFLAIAFAMRRDGCAMHVDGSPVFEVGSPPTRCRIEDPGLHGRLITVSDARRGSAGSSLHVVASSHRVVASLTTGCWLVSSLVCFVASRGRFACVRSAVIHSRSAIAFTSSPPSVRSRDLCLVRIAVSSPLVIAYAQRAVGSGVSARRISSSIRSPPPARRRLRRRPRNQTPVCERDIPLSLCHIR